MKKQFVSKPQRAKKLSSHLSASLFHSEMQCGDERALPTAAGLSRPYTNCPLCLKSIQSRSMQSVDPGGFGFLTLLTPSYFSLEC